MAFQAKKDCPVIGEFPSMLVPENLLGNSDQRMKHNE
jgi:hypothetical protein